MNEPKIRYLKSNEIDVVQWDKKIHKSVNASVFAYSWYLDIVCSNWDALVDESLDTLMPLPYVERGGRRFLIQPPLTYHLGIYSSDILQRKLSDLFVQQAATRFEYAKLVLNKYNDFSPSRNLRKLQHSLFELDLIANYTQLYSHYQIIVCLHLNAFHKKYNILAGLQPGDMVQFLKTRSQITLGNLGVEAIPLLQKLTAALYRYRMCETIGVFDQHNVLVAFFIAVSSNLKLSLLYFAVEKSHSKQMLFSGVIDYLIQHQCEKNLTLEIDTLANSDLEAVCRGVGASITSRPVLSVNSLPMVYKFFYR